MGPGEETTETKNWVLPALLLLAALLGLAWWSSQKQAQPQNAPQAEWRNLLGETMPEWQARVQRECDAEGKVLTFDRDAAGNITGATCCPPSEAHNQH